MLINNQPKLASFNEDGGLAILIFDQLTCNGQWNEEANKLQEALGIKNTN